MKKLSKHAPFNIPESDIPKKLRAGDHHAYDIVFLQYKTQINLFLQKLTRSKDVADDITQDVFINLWVKREQIDESRNIRNFLYVIARNAAINHFKREQVRKNTYAELSNGYGLDSAPDEMLIANEMGILAEITVDNMPRQRKTVYMLSRNEGLSHKEISQKLGISEESVRSHISLALRKIRDAVKMAYIIFVP